MLERRVSENATPLLVAAYSEQQQIAEALLQRGAKMDFIAAIALRRSELVRAMLEAKPWLVRMHSPDGLSALHIAVRFATPEIVALLIAAGADVERRTKRGKTPMSFKWERPFDNARPLLRHGADINARATHGFTPLHYAAAWGCADWLNFLIEHGANSELQTDARQTPWSLAVRHGHRQIAASLGPT